MPRQLVLCAILAVFVLPPLTRADDAAAAQSLLDRAIKAHGGAEALGKSRQMVRQVSGVMTFFDKDLSFKAEETMDLPKRFRAAFELSIGAQKLPLTLVIDGNRGWRSSGGMVQDMPPEELQELKAELYVWWVITLVPLKDKSFGLTALPETQVQGKPAVGVRVVKVGNEDLRLYFDKASELLVKVEHKGREAGAPVSREFLFAEHKTFEGVQLPTKFISTTNGKKVADVSSVSYRLLNRFEEGTFGRP